MLGLPVEDRLEGSIAAAIICSLKGAHIVRVHDVLATKRALMVANALEHDSLTQDSQIYQS